LILSLSAFIDSIYADLIFSVDKSLKLSVIEEKFSNAKRASLSAALQTVSTVSKSTFLLCEKQNDGNIMKNTIAIFEHILFLVSFYILLLKIL
jgi:hypothetical protein